jgi:hypothetical protein
MQLLRDAYGGDERARVLWAEYAGTMKGKSVLRFSPGLKSWAGVLDKSDEEAAAVSEADVQHLIAYIDGVVWERAKSGGLCRDDLLMEARKGRSAVVAYIEDCLSRRDVVMDRDARRDGKNAPSPLSPSRAVGLGAFCVSGQAPQGEQAKKGCVYAGPSFLLVSNENLHFPFSGPSQLRPVSMENFNGYEDEESHQAHLILCRTQGKGEGEKEGDGNDPDGSLDIPDTS